MTYPEELYDLAYQLKKTNIWKHIHETDVFAIRLDNGMIGYICIMGITGTLIGLNLYIGDKGFLSCKNLYYQDFDNGYDPELIYVQSCLQLSFDKKRSFREKEYNEVISYNKRHHINTNKYPNFMKYEFCCLPWPFFEKSEQGFMKQAMKTTIALAKQLKKQTAEEFGIYSFLDEKEILLVALDANGNLKKDGYIPQPEEKEEAFPVAVVRDTSYLENIHMFSQQGTYECKIIRIPNPVDFEDDRQAPYFPVVLLMVNRSTDNVLPIDLACNFEEEPEELLINTMEAMKTYHCYPKVLRCADERTYAALCDFAKKMNINISVSDKPLRKVETLAENFIQNIDSDVLEESTEKLEKVIDAIMKMPQKDLMDLPEEIKIELLGIAERRSVNEELCNKIIDKFQRGKNS